MKESEINKAFENCVMTMVKAGIDTRNYHEGELDCDLSRRWTIKFRSLKGQHAILFTDIQDLTKIKLVTEN